MNELAIRSAAESALRNLGRRSLTGERFSETDIRYIAEAISAAIVVYDRQKQSDEN